MKWCIATKVKKMTRFNCGIEIMVPLVLCYFSSTSVWTIYFYFSRYFIGIDPLMPLHPKESKMQGAKNLLHKFRQGYLLFSSKETFLFPNGTNHTSVFFDSGVPTNPSQAISFGYLLGRI